jgi:hypothetical protein
VGTQLLRTLEARAMGGALDGLSPRAIACLYVMALNAHDTGTKFDPARTYFRGWEHLAAAALGRVPYAAKDERAVARVIAELIDAGWIKAMGRRHGDRQAAALYELHI